MFFKMNATEHPMWWVYIDSDNDLLSAGNKPLHGPMLTQIYVARLS